MLYRLNYRVLTKFKWFKSVLEKKGLETSNLKVNSLKVSHYLSKNKLKFKFYTF